MTSTQQQTPVGRRTLLRAAVGAATFATASRASAASASTATTAAAATATATATTTPADRLHLLRRTTYGVTPELLAEVDAVGVNAWLDAQLDPAQIDDSACDAAAARFPLAQAPPQEVYARLLIGRPTAMYELQALTLTRAIWSKRQLFEVMVEFWSNHLNITCPSSPVWATRGAYDTDVIRKHALGRFSDMLVASSTSAAMMFYLDNKLSRGSAVNENYGREVLELHTVGRDAGYGQAGVVAASRAFSGMTCWDTGNTQDPTKYGTFRYRADWHYVGSLSVLGWTHPNTTRTGGLTVAESLMRYLAVHPATAARIARKLAVRFVSDDPPQALVDRLAQVYLDSDTAIVPVLRALLASPEFAASADAKYTRPYEDTVATMRVLGLQPSTDLVQKSLRDLVGQLDQLGQAPLAWGPPDGYPDVAAPWSGSGTVLGRWNLHAGLAKGAYRYGVVNPGTSLYARLLPGLAPTSRAELVTALHARLMPGRTLPTAHRDALVAFLGGPGPVRLADKTSLFPVLTALLLDSPAWSAR